MPHVVCAGGGTPALPVVRLQGMHVLHFAVATTFATSAAAARPTSRAVRSRSVSSTASASAAFAPLATAKLQTTGCGRQQRRNVRDVVRGRGCGAMGVFMVPLPSLRDVQRASITTIASSATSAPFAMQLEAGV